MTAKHISLGQPAHDLERQAIRRIVDGLPDTFTVYSNAWLVERGDGSRPGADPRAQASMILEVDAIVAAPHAIYVVEIKAYRSEVTGNDNDWYIPEPIRSPLRLNRRTAQVLKSALTRQSYDAGRVSVEHLVFLSHTTQVKIEGPASEGRIHTVKTILDELRSPAGLYKRLGNQRPPPVDAHTAAELDRLLRGVSASIKPPPRRIREYVLLQAEERTDRFVEHFAQHDISRHHRVLRIYPIDPLADEAARRKIEEACRWEAQVLAKVGQFPHVLRADPPFLDEAGLCLPFEHFSGVTLSTWVSRHHKSLSGNAGLKERAELWRKIALTLDHCHRQGVVHRLLRPEVVLVEDIAKGPDVRITGFDLAKQLHSTQTVAPSTVHDDRLRFAAPEVVRSFSQADARSDQFGLGALLGLLLAGRPLFESTSELIRRNGVIAHLKDIVISIPHALDAAVHRMLALRPADRFASVEEAISAVQTALDVRRGAPAPPAQPEAKLDPENIPPGTRLGPDYEIRDVLGRGGLAAVYEARHLPSGATRALKIAHRDDRSESILQTEYEALRGLDHANIVRAVDVSNVVPERRTLILERVRGKTLSRWISDVLEPDAQTLRRFAEGLLGALIYLEERGVLHKDIKPDNLVVGDDGLTLIDFSLAAEPPEALGVGTPLYRDPSLKVWDHAADRYAASLCLFELYTARHAFGGEAPAPGELPQIDDDELTPPGLAGFFRRALSPERRERFPSAFATRAAYLDALGQKVAPSIPPPGASVRGADDASTPLNASKLGGAPAAVLRLAGVLTQGDLVALRLEQIRSLRGLGKKKQEEVIAFRATLIERGILPSPSAPSAPRRMLWAELVGDATDVHRLGLPSGLTDALLRAGYSTIGRLAGATRDDLSALPGIGAGRIAQIAEALSTHGDRGAAEGPLATLDALWARAVRALRDRQEPALAQLFGVHDGVQRTQLAIGETFGLQPPEVSRLVRQALEVLDKQVLEAPLEHLGIELDNAGGLLRADEAVRAMCDRWPAGEDLDPMGFVSLLVHLDATNMRWLGRLEQVSDDVLARPAIDPGALDAFLRTARQLASGWPPADPEAARRSLRVLLPEFDHDPLALVTRLLTDIVLTDSGELVEATVRPERAIEYVLRRERPPMTIDALRESIERAFGAAVVLPEPVELLAILAALPSFTVDGDRVVPRGRPSAEPPRVAPDAPPPELLVADRSPEAVAGDLLRAAAARPGYRLVVTPPEAHRAVGRSIAHAMAGASFVSFEELLLERMEGEGTEAQRRDRFAAFERCERFIAQKKKLTREAEALFASLLAKHGDPRGIVVLGDTATLWLCDALHLVRRLYDETVSGERGFWVLVVPGVVHRQQPLFNETTPVFHLPGAMIPLGREIPA